MTNYLNETLEILVYVILYSPQNYDVLQQRKEYKDDAGAHPNIQSRNVTYSWCTLSETKKILHTRDEHIK